MKTITFLNKNYNCPESWQDVSVRQQMEVESLSNTQTYIKSLGVICAYTGIPMADLRTADTKDVIAIMQQLSFIDTPLANTPVFEFEYKDNKYSVSQTLMQSEFQDWVATQTAIAEYKDNNWKMLVYLLAIIAKRENETLDNYDINERAEHLMDIDVQTVNSIAAFFLSNQKLSELLSVLSSPKAQHEILLNKMQELKNTVKTLRKQRGGNVFIRLWIFAMNLYIKFYTRQLEKYFNSLPSNNSIVN